MRLDPSSSSHFELAHHLWPSKSNDLKALSCLILILPQRRYIRETKVKKRHKIAINRRTDRREVAIKERMAVTDGECERQMWVDMQVRWLAVLYDSQGS